MQHGTGLLINYAKSVFLAPWDNYEEYSSEILYIESILALKFENLVKIAKFIV